MEVESVVIRKTDHTKLVVIRSNVHLVDEGVDEVQLLLEVRSSNRCGRVEHDDDILLLSFWAI